MNEVELNEEKLNEGSQNEELDASRRSFLQAGALAAGAVSLGALQGLSTPTRAEAAKQSENYPVPPKLSAVPLKPSTLATEGISRRTHEEHFKLYEGYVRKSNELFEKISRVSRDPKDANATYSDIREMNVELTFALNGVKNHELYFDILGKSDSRPQGRLLQEINRAFGSVEKWRADMKAMGIAARGWVWTAWDHDLRRLMNYIGDSQNTFPIWNATPIVGLDVYEHAYFIDYGTRRADYIDAFLNNLNWDAIARRLTQTTRLVRDDGPRDMSIGTTF